MTRVNPTAIHNAFGRCDQTHWGNIWNVLHCIHIISSLCLFHLSTWEKIVYRETIAWCKYGRIYKYVSIKYWSILTFKVAMIGMRRINKIEATGRDYLQGMWPGQSEWGGHQMGKHVYTNVFLEIHSLNFNKLNISCWQTFLQGCDFFLA